LGGGIISINTTFIPVQGRSKVSGRTKDRKFDQILSIEQPAKKEQGD
jgi:hypothetical protein